MFRKIVVGNVLIIAFMLAFVVGESKAANPNLLGTWKATVNKISPLGCSSEEITIRILTQWGNLIGGDINIAESTIKWVGKISSSYGSYTYFYLNGSLLIGGNVRRVVLRGNYDSTNPNQISFSSLDVSEWENETLQNTHYDNRFTALRQ